jgi:hypothetical protein
VTTEPKAPKKRIRRGSAAQTTPAAVERRERDAQCVQLRRAGLGWDAIATQLGYSSAARAYEQFMSFMKEYPREDAVAARDLEADRYDQLQRAIWAKCLRGDTWSIDRALKLMDQRARLLGLNLPPQPFEPDGQETAKGLILGMADGLRAIVAAADSVPGLDDPAA